MMYFKESQIDIGLGILSVLRKEQEQIDRLQRAQEQIDERITELEALLAQLNDSEH